VVASSLARWAKLGRSQPISLPALHHEEKLHHVLLPVELDIKMLFERTNFTAPEVIAASEE
jgi:hypothetical protein